MVADRQEVLDHAHAVFGPVALIQVEQPVAGKALAAVAVAGLELLPLRAGFDAAGEACLALVAVVAPAAGAGVLLARIRHAEPAVHAAGGDEGGGDGFDWLGMWHRLIEKEL